MPLIAAARAYGLITGGPSVNIARCRRVLQEGARRGVQPQQVQVAELLSDMTVVEAFTGSTEGS